MRTHPLLGLAALVLGTTGCLFPYPPEGNHFGDGPLPPGPSCYDRLERYDGDKAAHGCGADATAQLASLPADLQRLVLCDSKLASLTGITRLGSLRELVLYRMKELPSLDALGRAVSLSKLDLTGAAGASYDFLAGLGRLQALVLRDTKLADAAPLAGLRDLVELDLSHTAVADLSPLARLGALRVLRLSGTPVKALGPLAGLASLEELELDGTKVEDLSPLGSLVRLRLLGIEGTQVRDLRPLHGLKNLRSVGALGAPVNDEQRFALEKAVNATRSEDDHLVVNSAGARSENPYCPIDRWREKN